MEGYCEATFAPLSLLRTKGRDFIFGMGVGENMERIAAYVAGRASTGEEG